MVEVGYLLLGIVAGILSGLFGIGGGIVMVPSLIFVFGMNILDANATSLASMLLPVGFLGVITYYKAGLINVKDSLWISLGLFLGSFLGGKFAVSMDEGILSKLYAGILFYIALSYFDLSTLFQKQKTQKINHSGLNYQVQHQKVKSPIHAIWAFLLVGFVAGVFAGLFGKGGGIVIVPLLISVFHYEAKAATATSLAALQLPVGLPSILVYAQNGHLHIYWAIIIALGIVLGVFFGSKMGIKLPSAIIKRVFAVFLLSVAIYMLVGYL